MTNQILFTLLNCSWQWVLLGGLMYVIIRRFRRANSTKHLLWLMFLLCLPILFVLNQFVPALAISGTASELTQTQPIEVKSLAAQDADLFAISSTKNNLQSEEHAVTGIKSSFNWTITDLILCIWAVGTLSMLIRVVFGLYRIQRLRRTAIVTDCDYQAICKRLAHKLNIKRPVSVYFSDQVVSPISFGWLSPVILIPRKLNLDQFELVAAHELAHIQRLDWIINLSSHLIGAIFFFHPIYHFLNRKLVHLRERICDDWVIQLTGARKNYAQCLLDTVHYNEKSIPLTLGLNEPSELETRINAILKNDRELDLQPKQRLRVMAVTLLLTCLPLLAMAQLIPLRSVQLSLFAQTPQELEKEADKTEKKQEMEKTKDGMIDRKQYKEDSHIKVKDPELFPKSEENKIYSGPQPDEKLPSLKVTGIEGELDGQTFDITATADEKSLVLFLQDTNAVGIKGLVTVSKLILKIDAIQKRHAKSTGAENSNQGLQIGVVLLADNLETLPEWARNMLKNEIPSVILKGISKDGREGPGSYGLNRNVAQTVLIAKAGKVLHNFAFTQPMLYSDPYLLGAIAQAIEVESATLEKWLNEDSAKRGKVDKLDEKTLAAKFTELKKALLDGKVSRSEAAEWLKKLGITWEEGEQLLNKAGVDIQMMETKRQNVNHRKVEVADPTGFNTSDENKIFSGPQPGEKLLPLKATSIRGEAKGKTFDFIAKADGKPLILFLQDESGVGLRELYNISSMVKKIANKSKQELQMSVVFLGDDPAALKQITHHVPKNVLVGISPNGREGPGNYGLNRNVSQTVIIAKEGNVLHNFAFAQPMLFADPHVLGAIADVIQEKPETVAKWLNKAPAEGEQMQRNRERMEREGVRDPSSEERNKRDGNPRVNPEGNQMERDSNRDPSPEQLVKRFDKDGDGKLNQEEGLAARRALAKRASQNRNRNDRVEVKNPAEFKKTEENKIFSGPQHGEELPPLKAMAINGEVKDKTTDFIPKAGGQPLVLLLQDENRLGLRGLVGFTRLLTQIAEISKQQFHINVVFLGDSPDTLAKLANKIVPHLPNNVLLGISQDGREGAGSYGLNRNVAQTVIIAKDGKVLHNFAFVQPMLRPDPHVLGAIGEAIGVKPATLEKWLNANNPVIKIKNPTEGEEDGKMLLNGMFELDGNVVHLDGTVVKFADLLSLLRNLPKEQKSMLIIQSDRDVLHEQIVKVIDIAGEAGIREIGFDIIKAETKRMNPDKAEEQRSKDSD